MRWVLPRLDRASGTCTSVTVIGWFRCVNTRSRCSWTTSQTTFWTDNRVITRTLPNARQPIHHPQQQLVLRGTDNLPCLRSHTYDVLTSSLRAGADWKEV